jgi:hypothetical protein
MNIFGVVVEKRVNVLLSREEMEFYSGVENKCNVVVKKKINVEL